MPFELIWRLCKDHPDRMFSQIWFYYDVLKRVWVKILFCLLLTIVTVLYYPILFPAILYNIVLSKESLVTKTSFLIFRFPSISFQICITNTYERNRRSAICLLKFYCKNIQNIKHIITVYISNTVYYVFCKIMLSYQIKILYSLELMQ